VKRKGEPEKKATTKGDLRFLPGVGSGVKGKEKNRDGSTRAQTTEEEVKGSFFKPWGGARQGAPQVVIWLTPHFKV